ncbi:capsular biosynthesis protein [Faecalicatena contorta]|uniref:protein-tyrosine-phosphatase n=1 Tax=Faecalicatena fissicatena TaxID=290055 RepID=A0ABS2E4H4_9FIRM|nr:MULTISPECIES: CpsB/CapC family capsule biosynthesis tyrosine phosphatase [Clostridia]MBM6684016.1 capsular biosynthesis protein [Faecalicatena contorta]MBM6711736.1 capsular biosynthesis protein [Faecalicatena contorta]MBM6736526.1 capsular biosynthesis protein [Faecalicatena fissicatena]HIX99761.1 capsular biosynthesis protein [Candidatus Dorea intestinigallinarum]
MTGLYDIHCHLLPGVDDGAETEKESEGMLAMEYNQGVRHIFLTPHYRRGMFETKQEKLDVLIQQICEMAHRIGPDLTVYPGCEFYADDRLLDTLEEHRKFFLGGSDHALIEFGAGTSQVELRETLCGVLSYGWTPVLAHAERYDCVTKDFTFLEELSDLGVLISVNAGSVLGQNGISAKKFCRSLIKYDLLDLIGSDAHGLRRRKPDLGACAAYLTKKYGSNYMRRIMIDHPQKIMEGR